MTASDPHSSTGTAACFAAYVLPHVLYLDELALRKKIGGVCCLAWNISFFKDAGQRAQHIDSVWNLVVADNPGAALPPDMEQGFKDELRDLSARKDDLFPGVFARIEKVELTSGRGGDVLTINSEGTVVSVTIVAHPNPKGLPALIAVMKEIRRGTEDEVELIEKARRTLGVLDDSIRGPGSNGTVNRLKGVR